MDPNDRHVLMESNLKWFADHRAEILYHEGKGYWTAGDVLRTFNKVSRISAMLCPSPTTIDDFNRACADYRETFI